MIYIEFIIYGGCYIYDVGSITYGGLCIYHRMNKCGVVYADR